MCSTLQDVLSEAQVKQYHGSEIITKNSILVKCSLHWGRIYGTSETILGLFKYLFLTQHHVHIHFLVDNYWTDIICNNSFDWLLFGFGNFVSDKVCNVFALVSFFLTNGVILTISYDLFLTLA